MQLSPKLEGKAIAIFRKMDTDDSREIDRKEALSYWKGKFAAINAEAMFNCVDRNNDGSIQFEEWMNFWRKVKATGYSDEEIDMEVFL